MTFSFHLFANGENLQVIVKQDDRLLGRLLFDDLAGWEEFKHQYIPERCVVGDCPDTACGTVRDPETHEDLPACAAHRDDEPMADVA